jgi:hypothetical protein
MRSRCLLLLPLSLTNAHLINPYLQIRDPTWPEDTTAALPPAPTSPAQILQQCAACQLVGQALNVCASLTPSFTALDTTAQAQCLCYSSTIWAPNIFDNAVESCANYASTAAPPAYGVLSNLENFCENVGNVNKPVTVFTLAPTGGGGNGAGSMSSYVASTSGGASPSLAITGYVGAGATNTANSGSGNAGSTASATGSGQGTSSPSKTTSETDITIAVGGSTGKASSVARKVMPKQNIIWIGLSISVGCLFL